MRKNYRAYLRIQRDKKTKYNKQLELFKNQYSFENVFTMQHFFACLPKCTKNVGWKASVQNYMWTCVSKITKDYQKIQTGELPKPVSDRDVVIYERGKRRIITPIHIRDRITQKVLCDFALVPILSKSLIYDNGASLQGKGVDFTRRRIMKHLQSAIKKWGNDFYILTFDFKDFFNSVPHSTCRKILTKYILDERLVEFTMEVIKSPYRTKILKIADLSEREEELARLDNDEMHGICLGSQVSQIMALIIANDIDHHIKDEMRYKEYCRYMDDGIIFARTKEELHELYSDIQQVCTRLGLIFNEKKTCVIKARKGFTFLKVRDYVTDSNKIVRKLTRPGIVRMRRKLKRFAPKVQEGTMTLDNVYDSMQSWLAHSAVAQSYRTRREMLKLYDELFNGYKITKKYKHQKGEDDVLQIDRWAKYRWGRNAA